MSDREALESVFIKSGYKDFKWIAPRDIMVKQWVRMKCRFGCYNYGMQACCPPNSPSISECREFFKEYSEGVIFHFEKKLDQPEDRHAWARETNKGLFSLEREVFLSGYYKAFLFYASNCRICAKCKNDKTQCVNPKMARPSLESMGVDVFGTARQYGFPINVLPDYTQTMNRFALLLVE